MSESANQTPPSMDIRQITIEEEMRSSYLDYAMSVIVSRAIPDVRDGLKPVHRRILYTMKENGFDFNRPYRKSARTVGDVMGKYHPHGDMAIYETLVRMAQDFSMSLMLIDGQGNFGSMDGDPAAAYRYTEARLAKAAHTLLEDIDKETVDFQPNFDNTTKEPSVLPARFPNLLVNGAGGIAVGMATNIPPHNLGEVLDACRAYVDNPSITIEELLRYVPGPDFPTGGIILGRRGIQDAYHSGKGSIVVRGKTHTEEFGKEREAIIITEIPYQVNKARLVERIAECVKAKTIEGISDLRDESDRDGVRVVIEVKKDADANVILNQLFKHTPLQTPFSANILALTGGRPQTMTLKDIIKDFVTFREEVITRRTRYDLTKAQERAHMLIGLAVAVVNIDEMITLIKEAPDPQVARERMMAKIWAAGEIVPLIHLVEPHSKNLQGTQYTLSEAQAKAILDLRLHRLTGLEREKIADELKEITKAIEELLSILNSREKLLGIMKDEFQALKDEFAVPRRTTIEEGEVNADIESLIQREEMVVTVSHRGYIKRVPLSTYRAQRRGGKGRSAMTTREEDFVDNIFVASTHTPLIFFSSRGIAYTLKVYRLPLGSPSARGKPIINLLPLQEGETISTILKLPENEKEWEGMDVLFATSSGDVRRNSLADFINIKANGKIAMKLTDQERLIAVKICTETNDALLTTRQGKCIRFPIKAVRQFASRNSTGVRGIKLAKGDEVISLSIFEEVAFTIEERDAYLRAANKLRRGEEEEESTAASSGEEGLTLSPDRFKELQENEQFILSVTDRGFGKRSSAYAYRVTNRGGQGLANIELTSKNGFVVSSFPVEDTDHIMLVTDQGKLIRCPVHDIRIAGRKTQGVTLFRIDAEEQVVSVSRVAETNDEEDTDSSLTEQNTFIEDESLDYSETELEE